MKINIFKNHPRVLWYADWSLEVKYMACAISKGLAYIITLYTITSLHCSLGLGENINGKNVLNTTSLYRKKIGWIPELERHYQFFVSSILEWDIFCHPLFLPLICTMYIWHTLSKSILVFLFESWLFVILVLYKVTCRFMQYEKESKKNGRSEEIKMGVFGIVWSKTTCTEGQNSEVKRAGEGRRPSATPLPPSMPHIIFFVFRQQWATTVRFVNNKKN